MNQSLRGSALVAIGCVIGLVGSLGTGVLADRETAEPVLPWEEARLLAEVLERVRIEYVDEVDEAELIEGAIRGMVAQLDPHSAFLSSDEFREIRINTTGNYSGVGLEVNMAEGLVRVVSPIDDTPAFRAGLRPGDIIVAIDGEPVDETSLDDTVSRMRGQPGTLVNLVVRRADSPPLLDFSLERARIQVASVKSELLEPDIGYVRITQFSETTSRDLRRAIERLSGDNGAPLDAIILDLRNNPGGVLDAAVDVSDAFLDNGLIVSADGRVEDARFQMEARPGDILEGGEIVVLVNAGSASASEIVAGALKDHHRATIMGAATFGKGSVQTVMPLSQGRAIKLTTSRYYTPSGESIHERGIVPDVTLDEPRRDGAVRDEADSLAGRDSVVRHALDYLKEQVEERKLAQHSTP